MSALWHGTYIGYYLCIVSVAPYLMVEDVYEKKFRQPAGPIVSGEHFDGSYTHDRFTVQTKSCKLLSHGNHTKCPPLICFKFMGVKGDGKE